MKRILLLSDMPPTSSYTGGIVLEQLFRNLPVDSYLCYAMLGRHIHPVISEEFSHMELVLDRKPSERIPSFPRRLRWLRAVFKAMGFAQERWNWLQAMRLKRRILRYCADKNIDTVFCVLQGQTTVRLAKPVAKALNAKLLVMVWDTLGWWLKHHRTDPISSYLLYKQLDKTMTYASACATASEGMSTLYRERYGIRCVPLIFSVAEDNIFPPRAERKDPKRCVIGFAGQLYAYDTLMAMINMLEQVNWNVGGVAIELAILGEGHEHLAKRYDHVQFLGWRNQKTLISSLAEFDVLYLPYMFNPSFKEEKQTSFPGKLVTYLAAGRPIFFHGPAYSSAATFLKQHQAGMVCDGLSKAQMYHCLEWLLRDTQLRETFVRHGHEAVRSQFSFTRQRELLSEFLEMPIPQPAHVAKAA